MIFFHTTIIEENYINKKKQLL